MSVARLWTSVRRGTASDNASRPGSTEAEPGLTVQVLLPTYGLVIETTVEPMVLVPSS